MCNYATLRGKGYRTKCGHVYCEDCAMKVFSDSNYCAICNTELNEGQVSEFLIGVSPGPIAHYMYQSIFQSNDWEETLNNVRNILKTTLDLVIWTLHQLYFEASKNTERVSILHCQNDQQRQNAMNVAMQLKSNAIAAEHRIRELEQQLKDHDRNTATLRENLGEKSKRCDAWEKAYNHLRRTRVANNESYGINSIDSAEKMVNMNNSSDSIDTGYATIAATRGFTTPPKIHKRPLVEQQEIDSSQLHVPSYRPLATLSSPDFETNPSRIVRRRTETTTVRYAEGFNHKSNKNTIDNEDFVPNLGNFVSRDDKNYDLLKNNHQIKFSVRNTTSIDNDKTPSSLQQQSQFATAENESERHPMRSSFFSHKSRSR